MKTPLKVVLGIATLWPLVYLFIFIGFAFYTILTVTPHAEVGRGPPAGLVAIFILHGITMLWMIGLIAIYIYDVFHNDSVDKDKKALWAVVLFCANMIAMPIYWYIYLWREDGRPAKEPNSK